MKTQQIVKTLFILLSSIIFFACAVDDRSFQESDGKEVQITLGNDNGDDDNGGDDDAIVLDDDSNDDLDLDTNDFDENSNDFNENTSSEYVTLTFNLGGQSNDSGRSIARTAIGTFEEISALYVNAIRQGKESLIYSEPGRPLTKQSDYNWTGTLDGFIVNESYTIRISAMNVS